MFLFEWPYRLIPIGLTSLLAILLLSKLARRAPQRMHGWRRIEPSPMHWTGLLLGGGLLLLFLAVRLFVGSSRADAEQQMSILTGLIIAFAVGVSLCGWSVFRLRRLDFEWRGSWCAWRDRTGKRSVQSIGDLVALKRSPLGFAVLSFADGAVVRIDEHARGTEELLEHIGELLAELDPPASLPA